MTMLHRTLAFLISLPLLSHADFPVPTENDKPLPKVPTYCVFTRPGTQTNTVGTSRYCIFPSQGGGAGTNASYNVHMCSFPLTGSGNVSTSPIMAAVTIFGQNREAPAPAAWPLEVKASGIDLDTRAPERDSAKLH